MKKFLAQIKENFDNAFFLIQLAAALIATLLTEYFEFTFIDRESLILYLLILIAFDLYFVAVHRIDKIIEKTQRIDEIVEEMQCIEASIEKMQHPEKSLDEYIQDRASSGPLDSFVRKANQSVFISGSTMVSLIISAGLLRGKLRKGVNVKIVLWDLCNDVEAKALTEFDCSSCTTLANQIKGTLAFLLPILDEFPNLEVRFLKTVILTDYVGIDVNSLEGLIKVQSRFYKETSDRFVNYIIRAEDAPSSFRKYREQIDKIWNDAVVLDSTYLDQFTAKYGDIK